MHIVSAIKIEHIQRDGISEQLTQDNHLNYRKYNGSCRFHQHEPMILHKRMSLNNSMNSKVRAAIGERMSNDAFTYKRDHFY